MPSTSTSTLRRYLRAFFVALRMTLRGEMPPPPSPQHATLQTWMEESLRLTNAVFITADAHGLPRDARQQFRLTIDRRPIAMETILQAVCYHLVQEYPHVLRHDPLHGLTAVYSSNLNDQYRVTRLAEAVTEPAVRAALEGLSTTLARIPQQNNPPEA